MKIKIILVLLSIVLFGYVYTQDSKQSLPDPGNSLPIELIGQ